MSIEFTDNSVKVKENLKSSVVAFLYEVGGELQSQIRRNSRVDTSKTKESYDYVVDEGADSSTVYVGSNYENAIWEEFGTGEYALSGGRKGGWVYKSPKTGKFVFTRGKSANRPMFKAFNSTKPKIERQLHNILSKL